VIVDGKNIALELKQELKEEVRKLDTHQLALGIIVAKDTPQIKQFVTIKEAFGKEIQVKVDILRLEVLEQKNEDLLKLLLHSTREHDGLILQLPIPNHFVLETILDLYPLSHDVDVLGNIAYEQFREGNLPFLPPVVGAFSEVLKRNNILLRDKEVTVVGSGRLVGGPAAIWAQRMGAHVTVVTKETADLKSYTQGADVLISGTGVPGLIQSDMIKEGVVLLDAGSGEMAGVIKGDADEACAEKAMLFTPTPGGIGPITVAKVFENLLTLYKLKHKPKM
jgi:methylenetetrahydrofolate dehydrogenase (NADP+) / methenyltetrahydrofolate cyclohydrolase